MSLLKYPDTFLSTLCTWKVKTSRREEFFKKGVLKKSTTFTGKHLHRGLFCNKAVGWRHAISLNTESGRGASCEFWEIFNNIYFVNVCESLLPWNKFFARVSFHNVIGFYYKRNRQLLYYEGTSSYIPLKTLERVNRAFFQNFSELLLLKMPQQSIICSKSTRKECFRNVNRVSL